MAHESKTMWVTRVVGDGRAAFPQLRVGDEVIAEILAGRFERGEHSLLLAADELFLAAACAIGDRQALEIFEQRYFGIIKPALASMRLSRDDLADVEQLLRIRLFVAEPGQVARVVTYAGTGQLGGLVRVAAVRLGINRLRERGRIERDDEGFERIAGGVDSPGIQKLKAVHRDATKQAFVAGIASLEPRQRSLLRLTYVNSTSIDGIGQIYGVHRATAARWVVQARDTLAVAVRRRLAEDLGVAIAEIDDALPLIESQLELSLERLLKTKVA
ncbi:MAG: transcriptional regulator [Kofleriaceae bacterium]|nr:transcriptional regulator [Kofleriaceae bacterium]